MESLKPLWLTPEGVSHLQNEQSRTRLLLQEITEQIRENAIAKDAEDFAQTIALRQQMQNRIKQLDYVLSRAKIATKTHGDTVEIGSTVYLSDGINKRVITIVGSEEADPIKGAISAESPLGEAVLGKIAGSHVWVQSPAGRRELIVTFVG